jgi:two-component system sensor histidine kinase UhpB
MPATELERQWMNLKQGDHACLLYQTAAEQVDSSVAFLKEGLARQESCLCVADDPTTEAIAQALLAARVDVAHERERGALKMRTAQDTYLPSGEFDPRAMIEFLRAARSQALADGWSGLRAMGEMTWVLGRASWAGLIEYEALLNGLVTNSRSVVLCQYNCEAFDALVIHDVLRTHPVVILGDLVCPNPYYEPPELVLSPEPEPSAEYKRKRVALWIAQLKRARVAEQERERALEKLKQSERRLAEAQQVAHIGSWERDLRTNQVTWSEELYRLFDLEPNEGEVSYRKFLSHILPQDAERIHLRIEEALRERRGFRCDYRVTRKNGDIRVLQDRGNVILNAEAQPIRLVGTAQDVTERKRAEKALRKYAARLKALSRRLLEVQEAERRHLARELHDEFGQVLSAITLHLHAARSLAGGAALPRLDECSKLLKQAGEQVRTLALELRPTMLDSLGLESTLRWLADHHQQATGCEVKVLGHLSGTPLPPELAIACFRVAQEALTNAMRHAAARHFWIEMSQSEKNLELAVSDDGVGFDVALIQVQAAKRGSLGLLGMRERVQVLGGTLDVESAPGRGTRIRARFPLRGAEEAQSRLGL